jgi:ribulose-phosphate 3-epimerase
MVIKIAPSILAADFLKLGAEIAAAEQGGADRLHLDVMDGMFVPNISFGMPVIEAVRRTATIPLEAHLMIAQPERYIEAIAQAGADTIIVHQEAALHLDRAIQQIKSAGKKAGVALNPATPVSMIGDLIEQLDLILIMTVNPGFGGQTLIPYTFAKVTQIREFINQRNPACDLEVDGGIDFDTAQTAVEAGANVLVAGTMIFSHPQGAASGVQNLVQSLKTLSA